MNKKIWILLLSCAMLLLAACGTSTEAPAEQPSEVSSQPTEASSEPVVAEDGQNPVMNFVGKYNAGDSMVEYMKDKTVHESDRQAMMDEDCLDMFVNGQPSDSAQRITSTERSTTHSQAVR